VYSWRSGSLRFLHIRSRVLRSLCKMELLRSCSLVSLVKVTPLAPFLLLGEKISFCQIESSRVYFMFSAATKEQEMKGTIAKLVGSFFYCILMGRQLFHWAEECPRWSSVGPSTEKKGVGGKVNYLEMMPSLFDSQPVNACTDSTPADSHLSPPLSSLCPT
jgi:hypothetical protein